ncbi:Hypothetical protein Trvi_ORF108 [Trabala vishnou gigantina nucleopolyhedrovirus]|uniref:Hypothetical protein n=1 Tax=Trabala vishnou gigantina nucleopolyhedrovirus TaxID=2863583 RepID=UPI002481F7A8|nr:Hypothetical protein QKU87_gp108 [Trabala vishnou gigantina nucleopolyhedrovirus]QYC92769.1 Hypothetical protein Trvi_ORF108 [Trabala vishnou gigantina nucleopolyhedrovirus]
MMQDSHKKNNKLNKDAIPKNELLEVKNRCEKMMKDMQALNKQLNEEIANQKQELLEVKKQCEDKITKVRDAEFNNRQLIEKIKKENELSIFDVGLIGLFGPRPPVKKWHSKH